MVDVCKELLSSSRISAEDKVQAKDIGVIAAFRQQVLRLRLRLRSEGLSNVNVGSVEDFQGQEMRVIIISTVLSSWEKRFDAQGCSGLVGDEKCVACCHDATTLLCPPMLTRSVICIIV